jgi:MoxR-like ATPase
MKGKKGGEIDRKVSDYHKLFLKIKNETKKIVVGQQEVVEGILRGIMCDGHILVEGVPGIAKTLIVRTLAKIMGIESSRVQFTADLLPTDITGLTIYDKSKGFTVLKGPIFANFVVGDEINRSPPKCVLKGTEVLMSDGSLQDIDRIFTNFLGELALKENNEEWHLPNRELKVMSFDPSDKKIKPKRIKYLYRQLTREPYYEIALKSGRNIKTSSVHPFFTIKNGFVSNIIAENLKRDDCVLVPKKVNIESDNNINYSLDFIRKADSARKEFFRRKRLYYDITKLEKRNLSYIINVLNLNESDKNLVRTYLRGKPDYLNLDISDDSLLIVPEKPGVINKINIPRKVNMELAHFFAFLIAECNQSGKNIYLSMKDEALVEYFVKLLDILFGIKTKVYRDNRNGQYRVALNSKPLEIFLRGIGYKIGSKSGNKVIPEAIMKASDDVVKEFLKVYYECDGSVCRDCVKVTTKSDKIANQISYLLLRFGLVSKINKEYIKSNFGEGYFYNLRLYGNSLGEFRNNINFFSDFKRAKLLDCSMKVSKSKNDTIPFMHSRIRNIRKSNSICHKEFYGSTGMNAWNLENENNRFGISRNILSLVSGSMQCFKEIDDIIYGDFYCDYVKSITVVYPNKDYYLYDFTIEDTHSFIAGFGGIISHNTQSAMLEAMQEKQVTIGKNTYLLPSPFFVMATQNPIESSGVYSLPEAQIDRFLFKLKIGYPNIDEEKEILNKNITLNKFEDYPLKKVMDAKKILELQKFVKKIYLSNDVEKYIVNITEATRDPNKYKLTMGKYIEWGGSPRASIAMFIAAKSEALLRGQSYVTPHHVKTIAHDVLRHRLLLNYEGQAENVDRDDIITEILKKVPIP